MQTKSRHHRREHLSQEDVNNFKKSIQLTDTQDIENCEQSSEQSGSRQTSIESVSSGEESKKICSKKTATSEGTTFIKALTQEEMEHARHEEYATDIMLGLRSITPSNMSYCDEIPSNESVVSRGGSKSLYVSSLNFSPVNEDNFDDEDSPFLLLSTEDVVKWTGQFIDYDKST